LDQLREAYTLSQEELSLAKHELSTLKRQVMGTKSEKLPSVKEQLRKERKTVPAQRRHGDADPKSKLEPERTQHTVSQDKRTCPKCGDTELRSIGTGKETEVFEYIPARMVRQVHVQETLACRCGEYVVTAEGEPKIFDGTCYGPGLVAHAVVAKCADSIPLYRQGKEFKRIGVPIHRSTMTDLFHRCAELLKPIANRLLELISKQQIVQADETPIKIMAKKKCRKGYIWTFRSDNLIGYRFSPNRSGQTPKQVLGGTLGTLVVDAYTGYNSVTDVDGRTRAGCLAHVRRKFFDAIPTAQVAEQALELILAVYRVEHEAKETNTVRTPAHHELRQKKSKPAMTCFHDWLEQQKPQHPPKSPIGQAIAYTENNWEALNQFITDVRIPLDNNASESALRVVALGRKNFLFVGNEQAGENLALLYSITATCEANHVNPTAYITDMLIRIQFHPLDRIDELLPQNWNSLQNTDPKDTS
jgi:transposase